MTPSHLLYDMPIWTLYISAGCLGVVWLGVVWLIVLVEAVTLRLLQWGTFGRSFRDALLMNVASTLVGCATPVILLATDSVPKTFVGLAVAWLLSIGIEGTVLVLVDSRQKAERHAMRQIWLASAIANTASYVMLGVLVPLASFLSS